MTITAQPSARPARRSISPAPQQVSTPVLLRAAAALVIVATIVVALVLAASARHLRGALDVLGHQTAPHVEATEDLYFELSDMDAQLTNVLLAGNDPALAAVRREALTTYEQRRTQADKNLQEAMKLAGAGDSARSLRDVLDHLGEYHGLAQRTIMLNDLERNPAGKPSAAVLDLQRHATQLLHSTLDTAHKLTDANGAALDQSYAEDQSITVDARAGLAILGLLLLGSLIVLQLVLRTKLRRRLNPALLLATALAGWLVIGGFTVMAKESEHLRGAKKEAFDSVIALRQARAVAYDANADESRWLIDPQRFNQYQDAFSTKSSALAEVGAADYAGYVDLLSSKLTTDRTARAVGGKGQMRGFFGTGLNNITFAGEQTAAEWVMATYLQYQRDDQELRAKIRRGDLLGAITYCTGHAPGNSNHDFEQFDHALTGWIDINQKAFDQSITDGKDWLAGWTGLLPYGFGVLIIALVAVGLWPRLSEYR